MNYWSSKKECRSFFKSLNAQEFARGLVQNQNSLNQQLRGFMAAQSGVWGAYRALPDEAHVEEVFRIPQVQWVFPRMRDGALEFHRTEDFTKGPYGVWEPAEIAPTVHLESLQGVLIPGLVFNKNGNRLGRGKGFYDKTLERYQGLRVGICFDFQVAESPIPMEDHDVRVDFLITESGLIDCKKWQE